MEGCLERKEAAETKRLGQEKQILKLIKDTAEKCQKTLDKLDLARVGKSNWRSFRKAWAKRTLRSGSGCRETLSAGHAARSVGESVLHGADHVEGQDIRDLVRRVLDFPGRVLFDQR